MNRLQLFVLVLMIVDQVQSYKENSPEKPKSKQIKNEKGVLVEKSSLKVETQKQTGSELSVLEKTKSIFTTNSLLTTLFKSPIFNMIKARVLALKDALESGVDSSKAKFNTLTDVKGSDNRTPRFKSMIKVKQTGSFTIELITKSYIYDINDDVYDLCSGIAPICRPAATSMLAAQYFVESNSNDDGPNKSEGNARLFSRVTVKLTCTNGRVTGLDLVDKDSKVGSEGPVTPPDPQFWKMDISVSGGVGKLGYMLIGRPHKAAELNMQAMKSRTSTYIWHYPKLLITSCTATEWFGKMGLGRSDFPTHVFWIDKVLWLKNTEGHIRNLWEPDPTDNTLVEGSYSNMF